MKPSIYGWLGGVLLAAAILCNGSLAGPAAASSAQASANIALIPGVHAPHYSDTHGIPPFPETDSQLSGYRFTDLAVSAVTPDALKSFDTVVLYGQRWSELSTSAQSAINDFARTHKVMIWDADSTGAQDYGSFLVPFSTVASNEGGGSHGSVVTFPSGTNPLASADPGSPLYLDPKALYASTHLIGHMNVMRAGAAGWAPSLIAANTRIPTAGWAVAWAYGSSNDHTGMVIYSGMDADAFTDAATPNYGIKELAIELSASFQQSADTACAPSCAPPPQGGEGGGSTSPGGGSTSPGSGSVQSGLGAPKSQTFALCSLAAAAPRTWLRGRVVLSLATSVADGIRGEATDAAGKVIGSGTTTTPGHLRIEVDTTMLPSDKRSSVTAAVFVNSVKACSVEALIAVDNRIPKLQLLKSKSTRSQRLITVRASENVRLTVLKGHTAVKTSYLSTGKKATVSLSRKLRAVTFVMVDRAGNRASRKVSWH